MKPTRLRFLIVAAALAALATPLAAQQAAQPTTLLPEQQAQHALSRLAYGARPGEVAQVRAIGVDKWIDRQLNPEKIPDAATADAIKRYTGINAATPDIIRSFRNLQQMRRAEQRRMGDTTGNTPPSPQFNVAAQRELANRSIQDLMAAKITRAATSDRQLYEVMVDFWENHFSVFQGKGQTRYYLPAYDRDVIRPHALGNFRTLLGAVAKSPAMLFYLDNFQSRADSGQPTTAGVRPFGRGGRSGGARGQAAQQELQIDRYCSGQRTEDNMPARLRQAPPEMVDDVVRGTPADCRRVLTELARRAQAPARGLNENYARELMELHTLGVDGGYTQKDVAEVARALTGWTIDQPSGGFAFNPMWHDAGPKTVLGVQLKEGRGIEDGEQVLDIVARHPSTAKYITTKLARRFISDDPPAAVVEKCSAVFTKTSGDIRQTLACVVKSPEFMSPAAYRAKVKTPYETMVSAMRATNSQLDLRRGGPQIMNFLGQPIFGRQTPDGWPDVAGEWMNAGAILNRINFGLALAADRVPGIVTGEVGEFEATRNDARERQVEAVIRVMFAGEVSPETREILMSGENPFASARAGEVPAMPPPDDPMRQRRPGQGGGMNLPAVALTGLDQIIGLALGAPEFQRR